MKRAVLLLLLLCTTYSFAQSPKDWRESLVQWMTAEDVEESYGTEAMELMEERAAERINLNRTSREELEELPFLTAQQVEDLTAYIDRYRPLRSISELMMVESLDWNTRKLLEFFVYVGDEEQRRTYPTMSDIAKYGKHTVMATAKVPFYERKGDDNGYLGYRYRHDVRYQFTYDNRIKLGITGAQDAGEPFFADRNRWGYDYYSYYFQLRNMGRLEELNVGMYRVQMGMGLVMNTGFYLGKLASLQSMGRTTHTLTAHSSRSQSGYLQGAAATVQIGKGWRVTGFVSYRAVDATLNDDGTMRTLVTDGYHRTPTEMAKKHNSYETDLGGTVGWRRGTLYVNANAVYTHFNRQLQPDQTVLYRHYAAEGNDFTNVSMDYGYNNERWGFAGETALNRSGAVATIHTVNYRPATNWSIMALHRYYDKRYTALHARSFSESGHTQNEHGLYLGTSWQPTRSWMLQCYADYAHFSWARYLVSDASDAFDAMLSARHTHGSWTLDGRYRIHIRQRDNADKTLLTNRTEHRMRVGASWQASPRLLLNTGVEGVVMLRAADNSRGVLWSGQANYQWRWLQLNGSVAWFHTDDYDSRLYRYERSVLNDFSFPAYYGHGLRYAFMAKADLGQHLTLTAKIGVTDYFDRAVISSGLQEIDRSSMTDLLLQLRCRF